MDAFLEKLISLNNNNNNNEIDEEEEEDLDENEFIETLHGSLKNLPSFFGLSDQLADQMLEHYFYDITEIGKYFATEEGKQKILDKFGIPSEKCSEKLYLLHAENVDEQYTCQLCKKKVSGGDIFSLICSHFYCRDCWISSVKEGNLKCLNDNCNCIMPFIDAHDLYPEIEPEKLKSMIQILAQLDYKLSLISKGTEFIDCPNCSTQLNLSFAKFGCILCRNCKQSFCLKCRKEAHLPLSCHENQKFKSMVSKYKGQYKELNLYKQYRSCKNRLNQQKKEIQQIIQFTMNSYKENEKKFIEIFDQNLKNIQKIYELIKNIANNDFDTFELINDQEFLNSSNTNQFKEKYPNQFAFFSNVYQETIKKEEEAKVHFNEILSLIDKFDADTELPDYLYNLKIIIGYVSPPKEIVYEEPYIEPIIDIEFEDEDEHNNNDNLNENPDLNLNSNSNKNDNDNDNKNDNDNDNDNDNKNDNDNDNGNDNKNDNDNDNKNDNDNDNKNDNENDILKEVEKQKREEEELIKKQELYNNNPYKEAFDVYMQLMKNGYGNQMPQIEYNMEDDPDIIEYSILKNFARIVKAHSNAFLHFHRKDENLPYLLALLDRMDKFLYRTDDNFIFDFSYYLILLRYFSKK